MTHTTQLARYFETECPLNKDGVAELLQSFRLKKYPRNTLLLREGGHDSQLRFINRGTVREFYQSDKRDININFYTKPHFLTDFSSFIQQIPTHRNQETLTTVEVLELSRERFSRLLEKYSCGKNFIDLTFQHLLKEKEAFEYNRMTKSAEELYEDLRENRSHWLQAVPQYHIASYLGITPETLSRIRKRIS